MENAQLIGLSRQIALQRQMEVVANNMANLNTYGFKNESVLFENFVMPKARDHSFPLADQQMNFTQDWATVHDFTQGGFTQTGNALDVALQGEGFFSIETPQGTRFTRDGAFKLDNTGTLVTSDGMPVMAETGVIRFSPNETGISFSPEGAVLSSAGNKGKLRIVEFDNPQFLKRDGQNRFSSPDEAAALPAAATTLVQGAVETSNVSGVTEMANMIRVNRAYQVVSQFIERHDDLRRNAIRRLGELSA